MDLALSADEEELRRGARRVLGERSSPKQVRAAMAREDGHDAELWRLCARELGWAGLAIGEDQGGVGMGGVALAAVMEECGRALACVPLLPTVMAATLIEVAGTAAQRGEQLGPIAAGEVIGAAALADAGGAWEVAGVGVTARLENGGWVLSGRKAGVVAGHLADVLVVAARVGVGKGVDLFLVPAAAPGVERRVQPTLDATRRVAEVTLNDVRLPAGARLGDGGEGEAGGAIERALDVVGAALAAEQLGGAERCLELSVDYAKVRVQFGRAIGSFQAVKHRCADMLVAVEAARSAVYWAGWAASHAPEELKHAGPLAMATASETFFDVAAETIQVHGGIGFTWEHDAHLYFKRARASAGLLGEPAWQRERLARRIGLGAGGEGPGAGTGTGTGTGTGGGG